MDRPEHMVIYGTQTGALRHLANYGQPYALCGAYIATGSRAYLIEERSPTCPTCTREAES